MDYLQYIMGFTLMMIFNLKMYQRYEFSKKITIIFTLLTYVAGVSGALAMGSIYNSVMSANGYTTDSLVAIFGAVIFTPIIMITLSIVSKVNWRRMIDMLSVGIIMILTCAKAGCFFYNCCWGVACDFGIYNEDIGAKLFPIQLVEAFIMLFIVAFTVWYSLKKDRIDGIVYPVMSIIYCCVRFFVEYFRYYEFEEQRNIILGLSFWQFCCVLVVIASVVWIALLRSDKINQRYQKKLSDKEEQERIQRYKERVFEKKKKKK